MAELLVALNGTKVGLLTKEPSGALSFRYAVSWLQTEGARPLSLSLPLTSQVYQGDQVLNFFDNLLPDSDAIKSRLQATFKVATSHPFDLLAAIGRDCIGAIQLYPIEKNGVNELASIKNITAVPLSQQAIAEKIANQQHTPLGLNGEDDFRISLAGAQEKLALLWYKNQWHQPQGSTPTSHIFKLPIGRLPHVNIDLTQSCENEYLCLKIMAAFGLPTAKAKIAHFGTHKALVVERFDRRWAENNKWLIRLPQEDLCQALGVSPAIKYENEGGPTIKQAMQLLLGSTHASQDRRNFFKAQIIFWLLAAIDGHGKNYSIYLLPNGSYRLTPFYDVISAFPLMATNLAKERVKMAMSVKGKNRHYHWHRMQPRHFITTGQNCGLSAVEVENIMQELVQLAPSVIEAIKSSLPADFPDAIYQAIVNGMLKQIEKLAVNK